MPKLSMIGLGVTGDRLRLEAKFLNLSHTAEIRPDKMKAKAASSCFFFVFFFFFFFFFFSFVCLFVFKRSDIENRELGTSFSCKKKKNNKIKK